MFLKNFKQNYSQKTRKINTIKILIKELHQSHQEFTETELPQISNFEKFEWLETVDKFLHYFFTYLHHITEFIY